MVKKQRRLISITKEIFIKLIEIFRKPIPFLINISILFLNIFINFIVSLDFLLKSLVQENPSKIYIVYFLANANSNNLIWFILILSYGVLRVPIVVCCSLCQLLCKSDCCRVIINLNIKLYSAKHRFQPRRLVTYNASATMAIADKLYTKLCTGSHWLVRFPWS